MRGNITPIPRLININKPIINNPFQSPFSICGPTNNIMHQARFELTYPGWKPGSLPNWDTDASNHHRH